MENSIVFLAIRQGLVSAAPLLLVGSFVLIFLSLPIDWYQGFLQNLLGGNIQAILQMIKEGCFDFLAIILLITISYRYARLKNIRAMRAISVPVVAVASYIAFLGMHKEGFAVSSFGVNGMFVAIVTAILSSMLFLKLRSLAFFRLRFHTAGTEADFVEALSSLLPALFTILSFAFANQCIVLLFGVASIQELFTQSIVTMFQGLGRTLFSGLLFIFFVHFFWFFGMHGGNIMDAVSQNLFASGLQENIQNIAAGLPPTEILSKTFFDTLVLMGGCGTTLCLVLALLLFSKNRSLKTLGKLAFLPTVFNINELLVFGLPIVLNPSFLLPFLLLPLLLTVFSYAATIFGFVPLVTTAVDWTVPVLLSGYTATGSIAGSILQLVNIGIGLVVYYPFVRLYEKKRMIDFHKNYADLLDLWQRSSENGEFLSLLDRGDQIGSVAKMLATDLQYAIQNRELFMCYQMQFNVKNYCVGAESLLRWRHDLAGFIPPPLIIALAKEAGLQLELEKLVLQMVCQDLHKINDGRKEQFVVSVNVTTDFLIDPCFEKELAQAVNQNKVLPQVLWIEITEQAALSNADSTLRKLTRLKEKGHRLIIDDFGMGYTSLLYLQDSLLINCKTRRIFGKTGYNE